MNKFINLRNGRISVASYRSTECRATTLDDLITCAIDGSDDYLTAGFDADELCKHPQAYDFLNDDFRKDFLNEYDDFLDEDFLNEAFTLLADRKNYSRF